MSHLLCLKDRHLHIGNIFLLYYSMSLSRIISKELHCAVCLKDVSEMLIFFLVKPHMLCCGQKAPCNKNHTLYLDLLF